MDPPRLSPISRVAARERLLVAAVLAAAWCWLFVPPFLQSRGFAFRDAGHYYFPLLQEVAAQRAAGRDPLWNSRENLGQPLLADATAAAYYPFSWLLTGLLPHVIANKLFIALHFALCAWISYLASRMRQHSRAASALAALSYTFGGYVVTQHANLVFLVSATWLPLAMVCGHAICTGRAGKQAVLGLAAALALQVLGGDPHTAAHIMLVLAVSALFFALRRSATQLENTPSAARVASPADAGRSAIRRLGLRWMLLGAAAVIALAFSALQVVPSANWIAATTRAASASPRSIWEALADRGEAIADRGEAIADRGEAIADRGEDGAGERPWQALWSPPTGDATHRHLYHFSLPPWRLVELAWPNFSGRTYPRYQRWTQPGFGETRVWNPTLYAGWIPLVLAGLAFRLRRGTAEQRWLSWLALAVLLAAFGQFGPGWIVQVLTGLRGQPANIGGATGGLYWWLVVTLPGYSMFRYPAKWLVIFAWAISQLAAIGWDRIDRGESKPPRRFLAIMLGISLVSATALCVTRSWWLGALARTASADTVFGPLQARGAWADLCLSLLQNAALCAVLLWLWRHWSRARLLPILLLALTAADLVAASSWQLATVPDALWRSRVEISTDIAARTPPSDAPVRVYRAHGWRPALWSQDSDAQRLTDVVRWDRATLFPKHHLLLQQPAVELLDTGSSTRSADHAALMRVAARMSRRRGVPDPQLLAALGVQYLILPAHTDAAPFAAPLPLDNAPHDTRLWQLNSALPRAWVVPEVEIQSPPTAGDPRSLDEQTRRVLYPQGTLRDWRRVAVVESRDWRPARTADVEAVATAEAGHGDESCDYRRVADDELHVDVTLARAGLLVVADAYDPGWRAVDAREGRPPQPLEVLRVNRVLRGVWLQPGRHRVVFPYRPPLWPGLAWFSLAAWVAGAAVLARQHACRSKKENEQVTAESTARAPRSKKA
jgi:hypothetical protein